MGTQSRSRHRACGALAALCAAILPVVADAQDPAIDRIEAIERKLRGLQGELQRLKGELGEAKQQLRQSRSEAQRAQEELREARRAAERERQDALKAATSEPQTTQTPPHTNAVAAAPPAAAESARVKVSMPKGRPTIATADGRVSLAIGGLVQFDIGGYFQHPNQNTQFPRLNDGVNLHRGRLYFVGKFDDFWLNITPDFGGSPDRAPTLYEANLKGARNDTIVGKGSGRGVLSSAGSAVRQRGAGSASPSELGAFTECPLEPLPCHQPSAR